MSGDTFENEADAATNAHSKKQGALNGAISEKGSFQLAKNGAGGATFESEDVRSS